MTSYKDLNKKVYCSYGHVSESNWIRELGFELTSNIADASVVVFGGGKDVDPGFYGEKCGKNTDSPNLRDRAEKKDFEYVQKQRANGKQIKTVGVCRGMQLVCALSGGRLIQNVTNHYGTHDLSTFDKLSLKINSIHHQMVYPYNLDKKHYKILGWSTKNLSSEYLNGFNKSLWLPDGFKEIEVIYFKNTDSLGIQCHPEMMFKSEKYKESMEWMTNLFTKFYENEI